MTEGDRARLAARANKELLEIEAASLRSLRKSSTEAASTALWSALDQDQESGVAEIDETAERMRREQPGKVWMCVRVCVWMWVSCAGLVWPVTSTTDLMFPPLLALPRAVLTDR